MSHSFRPRILTVIAMVACLPACGGGAARTDAPDRAPVAGQLEPGDLPRPSPAAGQCLLALWTRTAAAKLFFAATDNPPTAQLQLDRRTLVLQRVSGDGPETRGHAGTQRYRGEGYELTVRISLDATRTIQDGAIVPDAAVEVREPSGWSNVIPASGLIACGS